ncbi:hypothetical protein [Sphingopyxis sp.]|uniref:hypothetical protein n=1 Tax=Sphingopyxis sp. TaxID=1908224 RepID=UPI003D6CADE5
MKQRLWDDVEIGEVLEAFDFPLTVYRLVMAAGANRDFNAIHHNPDVARASGAPDIYANTLFLQGMWEKAVRVYIGPAGTIRRISGFRMSGFNVAGDRVTVRGRVIEKAIVDGAGLVTLEIWSENGSDISVGPGRVLATLPRAAR